MISKNQKRGVTLGIIWSLISWIPYYTDYLPTLRPIIGIPASLGLNLELLLDKGDSFAYSILLGAGIGFVISSLVDFAKDGIKIIGLFPRKKKKLYNRGL